MVGRDFHNRIRPVPLAVFSQDEDVLVLVGKGGVRRAPETPPCGTATLRVSLVPDDFPHRLDFSLQALINL